MRIVVTVLIVLLPSLGLACGGLFCNANTPVNQAAERILFAPTDTGLDMHVRITYQGPPTAFGWLLPVPQDVDYGLSSEMLFTQFDSLFAPRFNLRTEFDPNCDMQLSFGRSGSAPTLEASAEQDSADGGVSVLAREAVGPYDLVVLLPQTVEDLRTWLNENEYAIPEAADATLTPYVDMGSAFIALKLLPSAGSGDVQPLRLRFSGDIPSIPIVPTSVAADPDMGIIVHLLGDARAVSTNYLHVEINQATIDWLNGGQNYADVVSQAVDEAGGQAFVTDFAGPHDRQIQLSTVDDATLEQLASLNSENLQGVPLWIEVDRALRRIVAPNDADLRRIMNSVVDVPDEIELADFLSCPRCYEDHSSAGSVVVDVDALIGQIEDQINEPREALNALFESNPYLTRLYSTMSPQEMTLDPTFGWNRDLPDRPSMRRATRYVRCRQGEPDFAGAIIETESGIRFRVGEDDQVNVIRRQEGETVRGMEIPAALVIEEQMPAGQSRVLTDNAEAIQELLPTSRASSGCDCDASDGQPTPTALLLGVLLLWPIRRRFQR